MCLLLVQIIHEELENSHQLAQASEISHKVTPILTAPSLNLLSLNAAATATWYQVQNNSPPISFKLATAMM